VTRAARRVVSLAFAGAALVGACAPRETRLYDPRADAGAQLETAAARAAAGGKRVLAIIGGDW